MASEEHLDHIALEDEMRSSYMAYAMSVIVGRALPDARDGLKPVHRRTLYAMNEMGLASNRAYRKSAKIVGEIMGNYHPHGDSAIYDSEVRMAQGFNMRYPMIDGQGNFGSIDGDPPAAMRYTEARLTPLAEAMLADIDMETVDFRPTYDESSIEPVVLPSKAPNLLMNGSSGIAVGMATNIPPHCAAELIEGLLALMDNANITIEELMRFIPGPDFPTAGMIFGSQGIKSAYETGRGIIVLRGRATVEADEQKDRKSLVITELPFQVNKSKLMERIAGLIRDKKIEGVSDLRDESDRDGIRVVLDLKKGQIPTIILNQLYAMTPLQTSFGTILLALVRNTPQILTLKALLEEFLKHRQEVVVRRTAFQLKKALERAHILEGLSRALDNLDAVISLIRRSDSPQAARTRLMQQFELSEIQTNAILDMRLQRLTALEREKLMQEYRDVTERIAHLQSVLRSKDLVRDIIRTELGEIKAQYLEKRRTEIIPHAEDMTIEDLIAQEDMIITISNAGYIKRTPATLYRSQRRGGRGSAGMDIREEDFVSSLFVGSTHDYLLFFTDGGKVYWLKVHQLPEAGRNTKGRAIVNLLTLSEDEHVTTVLPVSKFRDDLYVVMGTKMGVVKKTELSAYSHPRSGGIIAINLDEGDKLIATEITDGHRHLMLGTKSGLVIRFKEEDVRSVGRSARGVRGISLVKGDEVIGMQTLEPDAKATILTVTENGFGKRSSSDHYRTQGRAGKGVISVKTTERNGNAVSFLQVSEDDEIMIMTAEGKVLRCPITNVREIGRNTQGVKLMGTQDNDRVVGVAKLAESSGQRDTGNGATRVTPEDTP
ncbi:MAG TPA: DNA gyrase subunit A [Nitrospirales bacterium]|nr:DNA gyrase subunit A [Nitrospirales bacterium]